jgi:hypothetical protein
MSAAATARGGDFAWGAIARRIVAVYRSAFTLAHRPTAPRAPIADGR